MIQPARLRSIHVRRAVVWPARRAETRRVCLDAVVDIVPHEQVEPPIAVEVQKRRRHTPRGVVRACLSGDVRKCSVAVVLEHLVPSKIRKVQVDAPVVVEVPGCDSKPVRPRADPTRIRDVGKSQRARAVCVHLQVIAEKPTLERQRTLRREQGGACPEHLTLNEKNIEVAVVVVIKHRDAGRQILGVIPLTRHAIEMDEVEAGFVGAVGKPLVPRTRAGTGRTGRLLGVGCPIGPAACDQHQHQKHRPRSDAHTA